ncbi:MAG: PilZ domain-containing protein [Bermanella sp.]
MSEQRRSFQRIPFDADTRVGQGDKSWQVSLIDVSLNGILFKQPANWHIHPGLPLSICINLADNTRIHMEIQLIHSTKNQVGCQCLHIDLDSITLLKRLIELNLGSDEFVGRELSALLAEQDSDL